MTEHRLPDEWLDAARRYNEPPGTPREDIWAGIEARRSGRRMTLLATSGEPSAGRSGRVRGGRRGRRLYAWGGASGLAAAAVLAAVMLRAPGVPVGETDALPAGGGETAELERRAGPPVLAGPPADDREDAATERGDGPVAEDARTRTYVERATRLADADDATRQAPLSPETISPERRPFTRDAGGFDAVARGAVVAHLGSVETLLAMAHADLATEPSDRAVEALSARATELLAATRAYLDAPGAGDPSLRPILEDAELVLAQVIHARAAPRREAPLVVATLETTNLIGRLAAMRGPMLAMDFERRDP